MMKSALSVLALSTVASAEQLRVALVGDSITFGYSGTTELGVPTQTEGNYPAELQQMLGDDYQVTNLGGNGLCMQVSSDLPYQNEMLNPHYATLLDQGPWDIVVIMLGTNDARLAWFGLPVEGGNNWRSDCHGPDALECGYAQDYAAMIAAVRATGDPEIYLATPPPMMAPTQLGLGPLFNQTAINSVLPTLIPQIAAANDITFPVIDVFGALGGNKQNEFPVDGCTTTTDAAKCPLFCNEQICDQVHPNDVGYKAIATAVKKALLKSHSKSHSKSHN